MSTVGTQPDVISCFDLGSSLARTLRWFHISNWEILWHATWCDFLFQFWDPKHRDPTQPVLILTFSFRLFRVGLQREGTDSGKLFSGFWAETWSGRGPERLPLDSGRRDVEFAAVFAPVTSLTFSFVSTFLICSHKGECIIHSITDTILHHKPMIF